MSGGRPRCPFCSGPLRLYSDGGRLAGACGACGAPLDSLVPPVERVRLDSVAVGDLVVLLQVGAVRASSSRPAAGGRWALEYVDPEGAPCRMVSGAGLLVDVVR